ncbi:MAG TPA: hypothetical protein EYO60_09460 [Candidatus Lambdaproteobacteria bacterium]|nr:hypothetical protein [Candidatus Lambdaproteobacteria bacterium]
MKKLISAILILFLCVGIYSCSKNDAASTATTATTDNSTPSVFIYPYSTSTQYAYNAHKVVNTCYGTNSSGYTSAPFYSTSTHDLKDRLPSSKWSNAVYSLQGHKISSSWESLWDGTIDMSLHQAEVIADNDSTGEIGFWTGTKSDGTFSGNNCRDWSSDTSTDKGTWGSFLTKNNYTWINKSTKGCNYYKYFLCFKYD